MALIGRKKKEDKKETETVVAVRTGKTQVPAGNNVIVRPRITEKASFIAEKDNVYVFEVARNANKRDIARAIHEIYKVNPIKIARVNTPAKKVFIRGKKGTVTGVRKAYVYLKKGEKIEVI